MIADMCTSANFPRVAMPKSCHVKMRARYLSRQAMVEVSIRSAVTPGNWRLSTNSNRRVMFPVRCELKRATALLDSQNRDSLKSTARILGRWKIALLSCQWNQALNRVWKFGSKVKAGVPTQFPKLRDLVWVPWCT